MLWIKTEDGQALRLIDDYEPILYIQPKSEKSGEEIFQILTDLELVKQVGWVYERIDINNEIKQKLLEVICPTIHHYNLFLKT